MYECLVCKLNDPDRLRQDCCPRCGSELVEIAGDFEEGIAKLSPWIRQNRERFYGGVTIGVMIHRWKDEKGILAPDRVDKVPIGVVSSMWDKVVWSRDKYGRIPEKKEIEVRCYVEYPNYNEKTRGIVSREMSVKLPNLLDAELQQIGVRVHEDDSFTLLLKNDSGKQSESSRQSLFVD